MLDYFKEIAEKYSLSLENVLSIEMCIRDSYMRGRDWEMVYVEMMYDNERVSGTLFDNTQSTTWTVKLGCWFKQM